MAFRKGLAPAKSMLLMHYDFPDNVVDMPIHEIKELALKRREWDREFHNVCDMSVSYESLCDGVEVTELPLSFSASFCSLIDVARQPLRTTVQKTRSIVLRNEGEVRCLALPM